MTEFTPFAGFSGGILIGLAATLLLFSHGQVAGVSGILAGSLPPWRGRAGWRLAFLGGLMAGAVVCQVVAPERIAPPTGHSVPLVALAGLLVGFGTRLGGGCTSGHGVCGLSRLSPRSLVAVLTFMGVGSVTASVVGAMLRGTP